MGIAEKLDQQENQRVEASNEDLGPTLEQDARSLAGELALAPPQPRPPQAAAIGAVLDRFLRRFILVYRYFHGITEKELGASYAAEWVLDNDYIVRTAYRQVAEELASGFFSELPRLAQGEMAGLPRAYALARRLVARSRAHIEPDQVRAYVRAFQEVSALTMGELWALPALLRLVVLQALDGAAWEATGLEENLPADLPPIPTSLPPPDLPPGSHPDQVVANAIISLRALNSENWRRFFQDLSVVDAILKEDPAGVYPMMDFETGDRMRKVVESLAPGAAMEEQDVARQVIKLAQAAPAQNGENASRRRHVGYYLLGAGRQELEARIGYHPTAGERFARWANRYAVPLYLGSILIVALAWLAVPLWMAARSQAHPLFLIAAGLLGLVPALTLAVDLVNWVASRLVKPKPLPKLDFSAGIQVEAASLIAVPVILGHPGQVENVLRQLERHYLTNSDPNLGIALLSDFQDADQEHLPQDSALVEALSEGIRHLNERYSHHPEAAGPFYLLHRSRRWNPGEGVWMGWERKRGKLHDLNRLILNGERGDFLPLPNSQLPKDRFRYVISLDADTDLPRGAAERLAATLHHPLNQPEFSAKPNGGEAVTAGYTVLQPRIEIDLASAVRTRFTRIFSGENGVDLYSRAISDVYQDLFGEGIYAGKGIYNVAAFERSLEGRVPENSLLSHDLFEGLQGRAGLVSDISLIEDFPPGYISYARRQRRWVRGDWQLLPWLLGRPPGERLPDVLTVLDRWKILDNLRRSLVSSMLFLFLVLGWLLHPSPWSWTVWGLISLAGPVLAEALNGLIAVVRSAGRPGAALGEQEQPANRFSWLPLWEGLKLGLARWAMEVVFMPYEASLHTEAILRTLYRLYVSRKGLLRWTTAADTALMFAGRSDTQLHWRQMAGSLIVGAGLSLVIAAFAPKALLPALPVLTVWVLSPQIAIWLSQPGVRQPAPLSEADQTVLRLLARRTWMFFERFVGPEDQWLPPDHFQENPLGVVAHRTSPTNIGLMLISTLAAYDFGYLGLLVLTSRLQAAFDSMDRLERYRGHFLNWYNTRTLTPLEPRYLSTVDSGNLAASLIALEQGCRDLEQSPLLRPQTWNGVLDTLGLLQEVLARIGKGQAQPAARRLISTIRSLESAITSQMGDLAAHFSLLKSVHEEGLARLDEELVVLLEASGDQLQPEDLHRIRLEMQYLRQRLDMMQREMEVLAAWARRLGEAPRLLDSTENQALSQALEGLQKALPLSIRLDQMDQAARDAHLALEALRVGLQNLPASNDVQQALDWSHALETDLGSAVMASKALLIGLQEIAERSATAVQVMDFSFLLDPRRKVFHIGYNLSMNRLDDNDYDLLASEARLASLVAIAKGDVPQNHWLHLGRPLTRVPEGLSLLSWSATMFEYLMPALLLRSIPGTLLHESMVTAVDHQVNYGARRAVPWGVSESGYYRFDPNMAYQYRAFGVPDLGYKRGLAEDLVIAPYASILALPFRPHAVLGNLKALDGQGLLGAYGLYEAVDYTAERLPVGSNHALVMEYMAHHQAMILLAIYNFLNQDRMIERFHADPRIQTVELLLQEQLPIGAPLEKPHVAESLGIRPPRPQVVMDPWRVRVKSLRPRVLLLSNGRWRTIITSAGSGYTAWKQTDLTRWRPDAVLDNWGTWVYVRDEQSDQLWSAGFQPARVTSKSRDTFFSPFKAEFRRQDESITTVMEIVVAPDDDAEIRVLTLTNLGENERELSLTSYGEVILAAQATDERHPAFNKLFIESEWLKEENTLFFRRRPRSQTEERVFLAHRVIAPPGELGEVTYESDRARFIGRGGNPHNPQALLTGSLSGTTGATLDPIFSLQVKFRIPPGATARFAFVTLAASSRDAALAAVDRFGAWQMVERVMTGARAQAEMDLRQLGMHSSQMERYGRLLSALLYPQPTYRPPSSVLAKNLRGQPSLWPYAISGDYPILLAEIASEDDVSLAHDLLLAHTFWRGRGLMIDLVFLNEKGADYGQEVTGALHRILPRTGSDAWLNRRGGIFIVNADRMDPQDLILLRSAARVSLNFSTGNLAGIEDPDDRLPIRLPAFQPSSVENREPQPDAPLPPVAGLQFENGLGGFSADGREYVIQIEPGAWTPAPWVNVIGYPEFGFLVSEAGSACTWAVNSGENRLTPWMNDPVRDSSGEALYLRDEETAEVWSPTPLPARAEGPYRVRHGAGYTIFEHSSHGLSQQVRMYAPPDAPLKIVRVRLENQHAYPRRITVTYYAEWVLGTSRDASQPTILPEFASEVQALLARNPYNVEFGGRVAFAAASKDLHGLTADRLEFLGRMGTRRLPAAIRRIGLAGTIQPGLDPCAALQLHVDLQPGEAEEVYFLLGQGKDRVQALDLVGRYRSLEAVDAAWEAVQRYWDDFLGAVQVRTPEPSLDLLLNRFLLYQAASCRVFGRTAFYQSSGAFGFRDQLQDVLAFLFSRPDLTREQILRAFQHQFKVGDVLHWWHPPSGRGVRTRISDDLLWLPYVVAEYVRTSGDLGILDECAPFLQGELLKPEEEERYGQYTPGGESFSLYEHCLRALEHGSTYGPHHLPLIGTGDWNDGMNRVGEQGHGESVWLAWFLIDTLQRFAEVCDLKGETAQGKVYRERAEGYRQALEASAWDGDWYLRAWYDDGTPLGSAKNRECQIDAIAQSWGALSGAGDPARVRSALKSVMERLVRAEDGLILLFTPPFDRTPRDPGYIKGYVPGIRENGGQYTHAAIWTAWAYSLRGEEGQAAELFSLLNPILHTDNPEKTARYRVEPYVVAADVYSVAPHIGRGGWTWYTGSAAWMYRFGLEAILGLRREGDILRLDPNTPPAWDGYEIEIRRGQAMYRIKIENPGHVGRGVQALEVDGQKRPDFSIPFVDDGKEHAVRVVMRGEGQGDKGMRESGE